MRFLLLFICLAASCVPARAQSDIDDLHQKLAVARNDSERNAAYNSIINYYQSDNPDSTAWYIEEGLREFGAKQYKQGVVSMLVLKAVEFSSRGKADSARQCYTQAFALSQAANDVKGIATVHNGLGVLDCKSTKYDEATKHFMTALKLFEQIHDTEGLASTYLKLGVVNEQSNSLDKAEQYFMTAMNFARNKNVKPMMRRHILNNLGIVYGKKGDMRKAINYFEQALAMIGPNQVGMRVSMLTNIGIAYANLGDDKKALACYDESLAILKGKERPDEMARVLINRTSIISKKDPAGAIADLKEALVLARQVDQKLLVMDIYDEMTDMYVALNDYKSAFNAYQMLKQVADSVFNIQKAKEIAQLQSVYELEKSNQRVAVLELLSKENLQKRNIIIVVALVLASALVLLGVMYRKSRALNNLLAKREKELQKSNTVKDKLFSIIGHDLRGPVGSIPMMLQLLKNDEEYTEDKKLLIDSLIAHSEASMETLDKLLYWGQAQIKGTGTNKVHFVVNDYLQNNLNLIKNSAEQKNITITDKIPAGINVIADTAHFEFIIRNLLSNAVKFTNTNGRVELMADKATDSGAVIFAVRDNGVGISEEALNKIFEPTGSSTPGTNNEKGTSIGLMLCREFVKENGGRIWVESEQGKGSTFYFSLRTS